jgi:hypothetical protein
MSSNTQRMLKLAQVQMAAEALYGLKEAAPGSVISGAIAPGALITGNDRASKFTLDAASEFSQNWSIVEHISNTGTGVSGTLFKAIKADATKGIVAGELVLSFRSTEFADDSARDSTATNTLEIKQKGWAFGQIADMESWYGHLKTAYATDFATAAGKVAVTGYSLGGHLATAFGILRRDEGKLSTETSEIVTGTLKGALDTFTLRNHTSANADLFSDSTVRALYRKSQKSSTREQASRRQT